MDILVQIIFGWPAIIMSIVLAATGILKKWPWLVVAAGVFAIPFSFYFSGYPIFYFTPLLLPLCLFGAAWALRGKRKFLPWILLTPLVAFSSLLAILVISQNG